MSRFSKNIRPYVEREINLAQVAMLEGKSREAFQYLENAHVLGQESAYHHLKVHCQMLRWGWKQGDKKEVIGQLFNLVGAATQTGLRLIPKGNTGGTRTNPFKAMPLKPEHAMIIATAKVDRR